MRPFSLPLSIMKQLIGKKIGMTQVYGEDNALIPVTVIEAGPCSVVQVKTAESDGYNAAQIGFQPVKDKHLTRSMKGHFAKFGAPASRTVREVRLDDASGVEPGQELTVAIFKDEAKVDVIGTTKGRGFQGVMRRYDFAGGPASHGHMTHRRGGSYGMCQFPGHVIKGKKMPGHMGDVRRTQQSLKVVRVIEEKNLILVKGSVPGANGTTVIVRGTVKKRKSA